MPDDPRVQLLLDELLDSDATPEEVCGSCVELLPTVRDRWRQLCRARAELDAMFPPLALAQAQAGTRGPTQTSADTHLPVISGYEVEGVLGVGGMGVVFRARHLGLNRIVALKMALAGAYAGPHERVRFQREAEAVAALRHPNVVQIYEVGEADGRPYFTMEYVDGGSLAQSLAGTPRPAREAATLLAALAEAVEAAHRTGIVHRDLKPANVLLTADGVPKVSDFGLARRADGEAGLTRTGLAVGTPSYMAPEQAQGRANAAGPAADVYSLGAILYEVLTGRPPFRVETAAETVHQLTSHDPVPPSRLNRTVPRDLETVCLKCLQKDSRLRYASAGALADDLGRFLNGEPIFARPLGWSGRVRRWVRRHPATAVLVASALVIAGLALGGGLWLQRDQAERQAETARREGRTWQAVEAAVDQAAMLQSEGRWQEARAVLAAAPSLDGTPSPANLSERVRQTQADTDLGAQLEEIRLGMSENRKPAGKVPAGASSYAAAFTAHGIDLSDPAAAAALVRKSAIRDTVTEYLHDWLYWVADDKRAALHSLLDLADDDNWRRAYRGAFVANDIGRLKALAAVPEAPDQAAVILSGLGGTLLAFNHREESLALLRAAQRRHPDDFWINYLLGHFLEDSNPQEAVGYFRAAVALRPGSDQARTLLGRALRNAGDAKGSEAALREAFALSPSHTAVWELARVLAPAGRFAEIVEVWEKLLESDPTDHACWHGYAQLCLFVGDEPAYRRARKALLGRFADRPANWVIAERTVIACLLRPAAGDDLRRAAALADWAVADAGRTPGDDNPFVNFVAGLSEYRQDHPDKAVPLLRASAAKLRDRAAPQLVLAMAQFRAGSPRDARETLAAAVRTNDWKAAADETLWVSHVFRREAEALILPEVPPFVRGGKLPAEKDERAALVGAYQSKGLHGAAARLFVTAFAADAPLAADWTADCLARAARETEPEQQVEILEAEGRYAAARSAAVAGCGLGNDAIDFDTSAREGLRHQAFGWLKADLADWEKALGSDSKVTRDAAKRMLMLWQTEPDLKGVRDPKALAGLPEGERDNWRAMWAAVSTALARAGS